MSTQNSRQNLFTADLDGLIAWLQTLDGSMQYDPYHPEKCPFSRFASAAGISNRGAYPALPGAIPDVRGLWHIIATPYPHTYRGALRRARRGAFWRRVGAFFGCA